LSGVDSLARYDRIKRIHEEVSGCRICEKHVPGFDKPPALDRGEAGRVMIVGQGPGQAELKGPRAFAGQSGHTLEKWLVACGTNAGMPRSGIYFTSVIKCVCPKVRFFPLMAMNCRGFLHRQIVELKPELLITLGRRAYEALKVSDEDYEEALCKPRNTSEFALITPYGFHVSLLHWPHPSGLNRWLNNDQNLNRLATSFEFVRHFLEGGR